MSAYLLCRVPIEWSVPQLCPVPLRSGDLFAQGWRDAGADRFDGPHGPGVRDRGRVHLKREAGDAAKGFAVPNDLLDHLVGAADEQGALRGSLRGEVGTGDGSPTALLADVGHGAGVAGEEVVDGLLRGRRDVAKGVHADLQLIG